MHLILLKGEGISERFQSIGSGNVRNWGTIFLNATESH